MVTELSRKVIFENAHKAINQEEWHERKYGYLERHKKARERLRELEDLKCERQTKRLMLDHFIQYLERNSDPLKEFDDRLWVSGIETVTTARAQAGFQLLKMVQALPDRYDYS